MFWSETIKKNVSENPKWWEDKAWFVFAFVRDIHSFIGCGVCYRFLDSRITL